MDSLVTSPDSCKLCRHDVIDKKEVISKLPDSLLHHILSFLSTIDAIRTSVLARRWKFLWTYLSDFNIEVMLSSSQKNETQKQMINYLFNQVDTILEKAKFIKKFRFVAYGIPVDVDQANSWIFALLKHKIQELELSLYLRSSFPLANTLPVPTSLSMMNLEFGCVLKVPTCIHFPSLKTLTLQYITFIDKTSAQQLFSSCPVLQKLTLCSCDWKNVRNVSIKIPTLTTLIIEDDFSRDDLLNCKVTIDAINLVSLSCTNYLSIEFILINLTTLAYAYIDVSNGCSSLAQYTISRAVELLSGICHVKSLVLSKDTLEILSRAENLLMRLPTFHNLIHFSVDQGMYDFTGGALMDILEKFPNLEVLDIVDVHPVLL